jgi:hypothetical protein
VRVPKKSAQDFHFKLHRIDAGYQAQLRFFEERGDRFDLLSEQVQLLLEIEFLHTASNQDILHDLRKRHAK